MATVAPPAARTSPRVVKEGDGEGVEKNPQTPKQDALGSKDGKGDTPGQEDSLASDAVERVVDSAEESKAADPAEGAQPPDSPRAGVWRVKAMLIAYTLLLLLGFTLSLLSDLSRAVPALLKWSLGLQIASSMFFLIVVPLTHLSGSWWHRKWRFYQPFSGGFRFMLFQGLAWSFYAMSLVLAIACLLFWSYLAKAAFGVLTSFGALGVLSQVFMVTSLFVYERQKSKGGATPRRGESTFAKARRSVMGLVEQWVYRDIFFTHNMALGVVAVALAVVAEYCWIDKSLPRHQDVARGAGLLSVLLFTTVVFNTYGVGGHMANGSTRQWRFWQPFFGGARFIVLQALSWSFFTVSVVVEVAFIISTFALGFELFVGAAVVAGAFFLASELLMILSLSFYMPTDTREGKLHHTAFRPVSVSDESLEQFRRLTVITVLSNMQYIPFLVPIVPFMACGLSLSEASPHWFGFFCCLTAGVVINAYVKNMLAKASKSGTGGEPDTKAAHTWAQALLAWGMPGLVSTLPALCTWHARESRAFPAWFVLTALYYAYVAMTFRGNPEVTGCRYLGESLMLYRGFSLYSFLEGIDQYFHGRVLSKGDLKPDGCYVFGFHPHGVQPFTVFWIQLSRCWRDHFKGVRFSVMTASVMHYVPLMRDILQWLGGREVSKESVLNALGKGESILLVPGGQQEMMESQSKADEVRIVTKHVGFIRIALQNGVPVVPVLSFGEVEVMDFLRLPTMQRFFISRIGIPVPFFPYGMLGFPIPRPVPVTVVFGKPMPLDKVPNPTAAQVDAVAKRYFAEIEKLFEEFKGQALGCENNRLVLL